MRGDVPHDLLVRGRPCVAIRDGKILAAGPEERVRSLLGTDVRVLDFEGSTVLPGLRDAHAHLVMTALARSRLDLHGMTLADVRRAVANRAAQDPPGTWIQGSGFSLDELGLGRHPDADDLAGIAPDHPVRLASHDLHALWVNRAGLRAAGRTEDSPSYLTEDEIRLFQDAAGRAGPAERLAATRSVLAEFHTHGITAVQEHLHLGEFETLETMADEGSLTIRITCSVRDHQFEEYLDRREDFADVPGLIHVNGQKMFLDGALGSRTAWVLDPYLDSGTTGERTRDPDLARERVARAAEAGIPTFFHAIGDAAVREALDLVEPWPGLPHRVEHAQLIHPDDLPRFAAQGVTASVQPVHLLTDTPVILERWGEQRARQCFPVRSLLESGAEVILGSDTPVETLDCMKGLFATVARRTIDGVGLPGDEAVPAGTALPLYFSFPELAPGHPADLSVWSEDPAQSTPEALVDLKPVATLFAGEVVHRS